MHLSADERMLQTAGGAAMCQAADASQVVTRLLDLLPPAPEQPRRVT